MIQLYDLLVNRSLSSSFSGMITFREGQLLTGKITDLFLDGTAAVQLKNGVFTAKLETALEKGKTYVFEVVSARSGEQPVLKSSDSLAHDRDWPKLLQKMELKNTSEHLRALSFLDEEGLPLTKGLVTASALLMKHSDNSEPKLDRAVLQKLSDLQLQPSKAVVMGLKNAMQGTHIQDDMQVLFDTLKNSDLRFPAASKTAALLKDYLFLQQSEENQENPQMKTRVPSSIQPVENFTAAAGVKESSSSMERPAEKHLLLSAGEKNGPALTQAVKEFFKQTFEQFIKTSGIHHEHQLLKPLPDKGDPADSLKMVLLALIEDKEAPPAVKMQAEHLISKVTGLQLLNMPAPADHSQQIYMQIPLPEGTFAKHLSIIWEGKKNKNNILDKDFCRIWLWLELEELKQLGVDINVQNKVMAITFFSSYQGIEILAQHAAEELKPYMSEMGYQLSSVSFKQHSGAQQAGTLSEKNQHLRTLDVKI
ncbi:hypothetical protein ACFFJY_11490 [Fictibacillus aquaticus]|uniref:Flagellar hook-length control protein-like C-terminal domain-containing protein n=1 Tax=Fictibacillus aquaticus TaxID=2021314 RepID=A0A235FC66_9BACL|nr:hypothetical protein [Fictibacillus aquaticus]OYD58871.1 hypothetical protein CGZ90_02930 [Fictibacillus aquaticus]